jgi:hypothetical protein
MSYATVLYSHLPGHYDHDAILRLFSFSKRVGAGDYRHDGIVEADALHPTIQPERCMDK